MFTLGMVTRVAETKAPERTGPMTKLQRSAAVALLAVACSGPSHDNPTQQARLAADAGIAMQIADAGIPIQVPDASIPTIQTTDAGDWRDAYVTNRAAVSPVERRSKGRCQ